MPAGRGGAGLRGRRRECAALEELVRHVAAGESRVLVLRGEAGLGKTALLDWVAECATGCRVARVGGHESEMELAFAGLHQLCAPMVDHLDRVPAPQRTALATAFGMSAGDPPDRFLVGLAVLSLMAEVAEEQPLFCLVDDVQWLDHASAVTLAFVARRLLAEPVGMVFATRDGGGRGLEGLPELRISGLRDVDARAVLTSGLHAPLDPAVVDRIVAETDGNPLALLELPQAMTPAELAGGFGLPSTMSVAGRIEAGFVRRIADLPGATQRMLLVAATEQVGDPMLVRRAAERLGIPADAAGPAIAADLVQVGGRLLFRHPLVRSAVYRSAGTADRQQVHRALAETIDGEVDPDRRAWHRALATPGPDEDVASELERSAGRAQARGGLAAAAAFLERSAALTLDPAMHLHRIIAAAAAHLEAGAAEASGALLTAAEAGPIDDSSRAQIELVRGYCEVMWGESRDGAERLLSAGRHLEAIDVPLARATYHGALDAAVIASHLAPETMLREAAEAARAAPAVLPDLARPQDLALDALAMAVIDGHAAAAPALRRALAAVRTGPLSPEERVRAPGISVATMLWDHEGYRELATSHVQMLRDLGALTMLPWGLTALAHAEVFGGALSTADSLIAEVASVIEATGSRVALYPAALLAGWRGQEADGEAVIDAVIDHATDQGQGMAVRIAESARATLYNGLGRYDRALAVAREANRDPPNWGSHLTLHELVESASRAGEPDIARDAVDRLSATTRASGTDWALGVEARSRALVHSGDTAEALYTEAVDRLDRTTVRAEAARAHLLYGEWLRRENRRVDARRHLRSAHGSFVAMGAEAFAERAGRELAATGETVRKRTVDTSEELTAQESQIAHLAADGRTNPEIGAALFLSARTVEWHLRKVYPKLGISSRRELRRALRERRGAPTSR
jgi:DNA-binding CsgD family transcriptional regulator